MKDVKIYNIIPSGVEFNARDINVLLGDNWESFSNSYSIDTEPILERLRLGGKLLRSTGYHCRWYIKI